MKKHIYDLLDQVTPANKEHKEFLRVVTFGLTLFIGTFGMLLSLFILIR
jgi:preprotein translocase subunit Sss1